PAEDLDEILGEAQLQRKGWTGPAPFQEALEPDGLQAVEIIQCAESLFRLPHPHESVTHGRPCLSSSPTPQRDDSNGKFKICKGDCAHDSRSYGLAKADPARRLSIQPAQ